MVEGGVGLSVGICCEVFWVVDFVYGFFCFI